MSPTRRGSDPRTRSMLDYSLGEMKGAQKGTGVSQRHIYSRISYLYQAATYLMNARVGGEPSKIIDGLQTEHSISKDHQELKDEEAEDIDGKEQESAPAPLHTSDASGLKDRVGPSCYLTSHLRSVSLKGQIRLSPAMKHSICKRCDAILIPGSTSSIRVENKSRGGKKAWADVLIVTCCLCNAVKRFPVGAKRQCRRPQRASERKLADLDSKINPTAS